MAKQQFENQNENAKIEIVCGSQGSGKSWTTIQFAEQYIEKTGLSCLIVDVKDEPVFRKYTTLYYDTNPELDRATRANGKRYTRNGKVYLNGIAHANLPQIYRIVCRRLDGEDMTTDELVEMMITISKYYKNGLLVCEEMNSYFPRQIPDEFWSFFTNVRKSGVDVILHYQRLGDAYPRVWGNAKKMRLHKTFDTASYPGTRTKLGDNFALVKIAENIVNMYYKATVEPREALVASTDKSKAATNTILKRHNAKVGAVFFFCNIDFLRRKIYGAMPYNVFEQAVKQYLWDDNPMEYKKILNRSEGGVRLYANEDDAIKHLIETEYKPMFGGFTKEEKQD